MTLELIPKPLSESPFGSGHQPPTNPPQQSSFSGECICMALGAIPKPPGAGLTRISRARSSQPKSRARAPTPFPGPRPDFQIVAAGLLRLSASDRPTARPLIPGVTLFFGGASFAAPRRDEVPAGPSGDTDSPPAPRLCSRIPRSEKPLLSRKLFARERGRYARLECIFFMRAYSFFFVE